jgi:two-component system, NarL family, nitrate/nitrite response regulator NarL
MLEPTRPRDVVEDPMRLLSPREAEVLEFASLGLTNAQIAARLKVSVHGVKFHLSAIYRKFRVMNRTEAVGMYLRASSTGDRSA